MRTVRIRNERETGEFGRQLAEQLNPGDIVAPGGWGLLNLSPARRLRL